MGVEDAMAETNRDDDINNAQPVPTKILHQTRTFASLKWDTSNDEQEYEGHGLYLPVVGLFYSCIS